jgi:hypothetical protein
MLLPIEVHATALNLYLGPGCPAAARTCVLYISISIGASGGVKAFSHINFHGLEAYLDNWRAKVPKATTLPHFPMVLHRGGYPDGS